MAFMRHNNNPGRRHNNNHNRHRPNGHSTSPVQNQGPRRNVSRVNQVFESNGPDGRIRGTAQQIVEKYTSMARDAQVSGDKVLMLNYFQHAEHYQRLLNEITEENAGYEREREQQRQQQQSQPVIDSAEPGDFTDNAEADQNVRPQQPRQQEDRNSQPRPERPGQERFERQERPERHERTPRPERQHDRPLDRSVDRPVADRPPAERSNDRHAERYQDRRPRMDRAREEDAADDDNALPNFLQVPITTGGPSKTPVKPPEQPVEKKEPPVPKAPAVKEPPAPQEAPTQEAAAVAPAPRRAGRPRKIAPVADAE